MLGQIKLAFQGLADAFLGYRYAQPHEAIDDFAKTLFNYPVRALARVAKEARRMGQMRHSIGVETDANSMKAQKMPTAAERASKVSVHDMASNEDAMLGQSVSVNVAKAVKERKQIGNKLLNVADEDVNPHSIVAKLTHAFGLKRNRPSAYKTFVNDDVTTFSVRVSNH